jgi:hypothetical protein
VLQQAVNFEILLFDDLLEAVHLLLFLDARLLGRYLVSESLSFLHIQTILLRSFKFLLQIFNFFLRPPEVTLISFALPASHLRF